MREDERGSVGTVGSVGNWSERVVLKTDDEKEVRLLAKVVQKIRNRGRANEKLETVKVTNVKNCGTGDRACVDCSTNFKVGEGLLVGNFANGLFLSTQRVLEWRRVRELGDRSG